MTAEQWLRAYLVVRKMLVGNSNQKLLVKADCEG